MLSGRRVLAVHSVGFKCPWFWALRKLHRKLIRELCFEWYVGYPYKYGHRAPPRLRRRLPPSGGQMMPLLPSGRSHARGWADGQEHKKMRDLWLQTPHKCFGWNEG